MVIVFSRFLWVLFEFCSDIEELDVAFVRRGARGFIENEKPRNLGLHENPRIEENDTIIKLGLFRC